MTWEVKLASFFPCKNGQFTSGVLVHSISLWSRSLIGEWLQDRASSPEEIPSSPGGVDDVTGRWRNPNSEWSRWCRGSGRVLSSLQCGRCCKNNKMAATHDDLVLPGRHWRSKNGAKERIVRSQGAKPIRICNAQEFQLSERSLFEIW